MDNEETKKQLKETIEILENFFFKMDGYFEVPDDKGWFYMSKKTADKLKQQITKYKTR